MTELQVRRADNIVWTGAADHSFAPDFRAYDREGRVDLYWNILYGAARRHYEYGKLEELFRMLDRYRDAGAYESVFWDAMEPLLYRRERVSRPVLDRIRPEAAEPELKLDDGMTTDEIVEAARRFFLERYGLYGDGRMRLKYRLPRFRRLVVDSFLQRGRIVIHDRDLYRGDMPVVSGGFSRSTQLDESELRAFLESKFGKSMLPAGRATQLEKQLCTGNHRFTHLLWTRGERSELRGIYSTFEMHQRKRQAEVVANNRAWFRRNLVQNRLLITKLRTGIMNSVLMHMQPEAVRSGLGALDPALAWRAARLDDGRVFTRTENGNAGDLSVDLLLDASHSQITRAAQISAQAYIISEALSGCGIPCRVMSFCSMSGFTVMRMFRDYGERDGESIFDYYAEGCSRDGLAIRAAGEMVGRSQTEHRMLIVMSDVKPLDVAKIRKDERDVGVSYDDIRALRDTAQEVRRLRADGVAVICLFTGEDNALASARMVYGQDFVRVRDHSTLADTVGKLIMQQITSL